MRIIDVREVAVELSGTASNAVVSFDDHTVSLVALVTDQTNGGQPLIGFGFNSIGRYAQSGIINDRLKPRLQSTKPADLLDDEAMLSPAKVASTLMNNEKPGGHGDRAGAVAAIELAAWDLRAKSQGQPACQTIAASFGRSKVLPCAPVYAAGGYYYPDDSLSRLQEEFEQYTEAGYQSFKMKIGGVDLVQDMQRIEAALEVAGDGSNLAVDANGRFDLATAMQYGEAIASFQLKWYEEPGDPLDYRLNAELTASYDGAVATGENLFSRQDTNNLIQFAGMRPGTDIFQMDAGLSYGLTEYAAMLELLEAHGHDRSQCRPHGGHLINLHIVLGLGLGGCEAYPGLFRPFGGYSAACKIEAGKVHPSAAPGFGLEEKTELEPWLSRLCEGL